MLMNSVTVLTTLQIDLLQKSTASSEESISNADQNVLFYISGYIIRALKKRYMKQKSTHSKQKAEFMASLVTRKEADKG